jgi:hypothetical protein
MITIKWGKDDKTVLLYEFEGSWSIEDLTDALDAGVEVTNRYEHEMDVIVDLSRSGWPNILGMNVNKAFGKAMGRGDEHLADKENEAGIIVIVSRNPIIRGSLASMMQVYKRMGDRIALANTLDEAKQTVATYRETGNAPERISA